MSSFVLVPGTKTKGTKTKLVAEYSRFCYAESQLEANDKPSAAREMFMADYSIGPLELVLDARAALAETPVWDDLTQTLYWVDIEGCCIHRYDPADGSDQSFLMDQRVGSIALRQAGGLVAAMQNGFYLIDLEKGSVHPIADPERDLTNNRFNDGKCDPAGRFWAGTMGLSKPRQPVGALYSLFADHQVHRMLSGVRTSNGLAWSLDQRTLYYIDTPCQTVDALDYDLETGEIANRRPVIHIPADQGRPDGMTIDRAGMLWVAHWSGWQIARYNPHTGDQLAVIRVPVENVSCCTFGGADLDWLYITTAREGQSEAALEKQPLAGGIFRVQVSIAGLPAARFAG